MSQSPTRHVFMSYSRRDEVVMRRVAEYLRSQDIKVWVDNEKLVPGTPIWEEEIEKAIHGASAVVVILSPDSKKSVWVRREISLAEQHRKRIFPVMVAGDEDSSLTLRLITSQYVDIRTNEKAGLASLKKALSFYLEELDLQEKARVEFLAKEKTDREAARKAAAKEEPKQNTKKKAKEELPVKEKNRSASGETTSHPKTGQKDIQESVRKEIRANPLINESQKVTTRKTWRNIGIIAISIILIAVAISSIFNGSSDCLKPNVYCVGLVTDIGGLNDKSYNQSTWESLKQAEADLGAKIYYIETTDSSDYEKNITTFADQNYDVIVTVNFNMGDATAKAASQYPKIKFIGVGQLQDSVIPNLVGLSFPEDKAGFLAGSFAAMMSKSHKIGAVCGTDVVPPVWRYGESYKAGAKYADNTRSTSTEVFVAYHNDVGFDKTFIDPEWGAATANQLVDQGADIIFSCDSSQTGNGAISAAAQSGTYVIGTDIDQYFNLPEASPRLLTSVIKLITPGVFDLIKLAEDGNFPSGDYLGNVGYAPFHDLESDISSDVKLELEKINAGLLNGSIQTNVPSVKQ